MIWLRRDEEFEPGSTRHYTSHRQPIDIDPRDVALFRSALEDPDEKTDTPEDKNPSKFKSASEMLEIQKGGTELTVSDLRAFREAGVELNHEDILRFQNNGVAMSASDILGFQKGGIEFSEADLMALSLKGVKFTGENLITFSDQGASLPRWESSFSKQPGLKSATQKGTS